ncbi:MAG: CPBP family intramembrane glutamic endopeptidase [Parvibaculaceae bacterium]
MLDQIFGPRPHVPAPGLRALSTTLCFLAVAVLGFVLCIAIAVGFLLLVPGQMALFRESCAEAVNFNTEPACRPFEAVFSVSLYLLIPASLALLASLRRGSAAENLLLRSPGWELKQYVAFIALIFVAAQGIEIVLRLVSAALGVDLSPMNDDLARPREWLGADPFSAGLMGLLIVVLAPFTEETVFRGFLFRPFLDTPLRAILAGGTLTLLWTLLHWSYAWQNLLTIGVLGVLFAYATWRTGSVWPAIAGHAANNVMAAVVSFLYQP